ncbi:MAG: putative membrane protein YdjX (TVP38/TMEM64 family), partial [Ulvibacter sp.]
FILANILGYIPVCLLYTYLGSISANRDLFLLAVLINLLVAGTFWWIKVVILKKKAVQEE